MFKKIFILTLTLLISVVTVSAAVIEGPNIVYSMSPNSIDLTQVSIDIKEEDKYIPFLDSVENLREEMEEVGDTGAAKTSIYFESEEDRKQNLLRVDIDFTGDILVLPVNTMFVTDQSGSMNMTAGQSSGSVSTTPCLHEDHVYEVRIRIDGVFYNYYHAPSESAWTGDWYDSNGKKKILEEIRTHAIKEGVATDTSIISTVSNYFYIHTDENRPSNFHYDYSGTSILKNAERLYIETPVTDEEIRKEELRKKNFVKIENNTFNQLAPTSVWEFYSPVPIDTSISAGDYIASLNAASLCYDRMNISKSVFHELSEIALTNSGNYVGFANFARQLYGSQSLSTEPLDDSFLNTIGRQSTYYEQGLNFAKAEFTKEGEAHSNNQNLLVFVTDGSPNGVLNSNAEMIAYMDEFVKETGAIVYFIGIDIPTDYFNRWGPLIATSDSYGEENMRNSQNPQDLLNIQEELKKILTATTHISTNIESDFYMSIDDNHPVEVTYMIKDSIEVFTEKANSISDLEKLGITYDSTTGHVNWDTANRGITSARLTFYKKFDEAKIDWDKIEGGETLVGTSLGESGTSYLDYSGREKEINMDDTASYIIEKHSKLTIQNTTSTPYNVDVNDVINYQITVTNTGTLDSDNNFVYQQVPVGTKYLSSPDGIYDEGKNLIIFEIPDLKAGETLVFNYSVTAIEYDFEINSQAKLGVKDQPVTLFDDGTPILEAEILTHRTPKPETNIPDTGDNYNVVYYVIGILIALLVILLLMVKKKETK